MKKVLFLLVSALLAGSTYASNLGKEVIAKVTNNQEESITEQQNQSLILEQPASAQIHMDQHGSHVSHSSHSSHWSHRSHSSHYSSRFA